MSRRVPMFPEAFRDQEAQDQSQAHQDTQECQACQDTQAYQESQNQESQASSSSSSGLSRHLVAGEMAEALSLAGRTTCWGRCLIAAAQHMLGMRGCCADVCMLHCAWGYAGNLVVPWVGHHSAVVLPRQLQDMMLHCSDGGVYTAMLQRR
jgi:hypothetical protein